MHSDVKMRNKWQCVCSVESDDIILTAIFPMVKKEVRLLDNLEKTSQVVVSHGLQCKQGVWLLECCEGWWCPLSLSSTNITVNLEWRMITALLPQYCAVWARKNSYGPCLPSDSMICEMDNSCNCSMVIMTSPSRHKLAFSVMLMTCPASCFMVCFLIKLGIECQSTPVFPHVFLFLAMHKEADLQQWLQVRKKTCSILKYSSILNLKLLSLPGWCFHFHVISNVEKCYFKKGRGGQRLAT